jgi:formyltetrahydrofolate deformylase
MKAQTARLLICCPDRPGIIAAVAGFVAGHAGNVLEADQHSDPHQGLFFMRLEIELSGFGLNHNTFDAAWAELSNRYEMRWHMHWGNETKRLAILVTKEGHCLSDLLWRWRSGELRADIPLVISNHPELGQHVTGEGIRFHHITMKAGQKNTQEDQVRTLLEKERVDLVVLARYMQVLSPEFVTAYPERIINIHHSFLPAFAGPKPYHQAYERGVKIIGATSHYVTDELDTGPIIAQQTLTIDHRDTIDDLVRKGRDLERVVLATAVRQHVEDKILVSHNRTVVFD